MVGEEGAKEGLLVGGCEGESQTLFSVSLTPHWGEAAFPPSERNPALSRNPLITTRNIKTLKISFVLETTSSVVIKIFHLFVYFLTAKDYIYNIHFGK